MVSILYPHFFRNRFRPKRYRTDRLPPELDGATVQIANRPNLTAVFLQMNSITNVTALGADHPNVTAEAYHLKNATAGFLQIVSIPTVTAEAPYHPNVTAEAVYCQNVTAKAAYHPNERYAHDA